MISVKYNYEIKTFNENNLKKGVFDDILNL